MPSPEKERSRWRWTCPHHKGGPMTLRSAERHLQRRHYDCWSCRVERTMVRAMIEGRGWVSPLGTDGMRSLSPGHPAY